MRDRRRLQRLVRVLVLGALAVGMVAVPGAPAVAAEHDDAVGYTFGRAVSGGIPTVRGDCDFYRIDLDTAALHRVNTDPVPCGDGLTFDDDGTLYAYRSLPAQALVFGTTQLITIDTHTGAQHVVGELPPVSVGSGGMTFDHNGKLWLYATVDADPLDCSGLLACLWQVDPDNAHTTFVGTAPEGVVVGGLAGDCEDVLGISSRFVTPLSQDSSSVAGAPTQTELDEVNTSNAGLSKLVDLPGVPYPTGLDFDSDGKLWAIAGAGITFGPGVPPWALLLLDPDHGVVHQTSITFNGNRFEGFLSGLGISSISCEDRDHEAPPPAAAAPAVVVQPTFTG